MNNQEKKVASEGDPEKETEIVELLTADVNTLTEMFKVIKATCEDMKSPWATVQSPDKEQLN